VSLLQTPGRATDATLRSLVQWTADKLRVLYAERGAPVAIRAIVDAVLDDALRA